MPRGLPTHGNLELENTSIIHLNSIRQNISIQNEHLDLFKTKWLHRFMAEDIWCRLAGNKFDKATLKKIFSSNNQSWIGEVKLGLLII